MPFVPVTDTVAIDVIYDWDGQIVENTLYYKMASPSDAAIAAQVDVVTAYIRDTIMPLLTQLISLVRVVGTLLDAVDAFTVTNTTDLPQAGSILTGTAKSFPGNVTMAVSFRTAAAGRSGRGRNYVPGLVDLRDGNSLLDDVYAGEVVDAWAGLRTLGSEDGWSQVVVSRFSGFTIVDGKKVPTPRVAGVTHVVTSTILTDRTLDSQRRRLPGRGS
jgi:hypothetical protein